MSNLIAPAALPDGSRVWMAPETMDFTRRLEELDPRLALVQDEAGAWSIWRVPEDGSDPVMICRSKPGAKLAPEVIERLRQRDTRAGHDPAAEMIRNNDRVVKETRDREDEARFLALDAVLSKAWRGRVPTTDEGFEAQL